MYSDNKDDVDKVELFLSETNSHPTSSIPRSAFCLLNDVSI